MYADRHAGARGGIRPVSLGASLLINGAVLLALIYAAPHVVPTREPPLKIDFVPIPLPPPPKPEPQPHLRTPAPAPQPLAPQPRVALPTTPSVEIAPSHPIDPGPILGLGEGPTVTPSPSPLPALVGASIDPRYADAFQPAYPPSERRANHEGRVVVRVLIGVDGRVKQVEPVSATSDAFLAATRRQALAKWRFTPATRGAVPVEQWKTMSVRFVLEDE